MRWIACAALLVSLGVTSVARAEQAPTGPARLEEGPTVAAGGGLMFGGNARDGLGGTGQGNAGVLLGVRAAWLPIIAWRFAFGPDAVVARWTSEVGATEASMALVGARMQYTTEEDIAVYLAARGGVWIERARAMGEAGVGGFTKLGAAGRWRLGWEVGVDIWRENAIEYYPTNWLPMYDKLRGPFPFVGVHAWFEVGYRL